MKHFLFLGDSITDCGHSFDPENLGNGYVRMIHGYFREQHEPVHLENMGVDGFTIPAVNRLWNLFCSDSNPDLITLLVGINDLAVAKNTGKDTELAMLEFQHQYESLIRQIQKETTCPILLMEPFIFPWPAMFASWEEDVKKMNTIIAEIAGKYHLQYLPLWEPLSNAASKYGYDAITLDGVHLTNMGHQIIADLWIQFLLRSPLP